MDSQLGLFCGASQGEVSKPRMKYSRCAYRLETRRFKEPDYPYNGVALDQPAKVLNFVKSLESSDIERMLVLYLDTKNKLVCLQVFCGTIDRSVIYPREIIKHALLANAANVILVHNHPSGDPTPSPEDQHLTKGLVETLKVVEIRTLDHIIMGTEGKYYSFCESRMMP